MEWRDSQDLERLTLEIEPTTSSTTVAMTPGGFTLRDQTQGIAAGWWLAAAVLVSSTVASFKEPFNAFKSGKLSRPP